MKKKQNQEQNDYQVLLQRTLADFENYKKRVEGEKAIWTNQAKADLLISLLPILDNLVLMMNHKPKELEKNPWAEGVSLVAKQIENMLDSEGIEKVTANPGDPFNPQIHEAVAAIENQAIKSGNIVQMQKPGYKIGDKIIRVAQVITSKDQDGKTNETSQI